MSQEDFIKDAQAWAKAAKLPDPWKRYVQNARRAAQRHITWALSFEEWWGLWKPHYAERGRKRGQKVLCRYMDLGDYRIGNVRIDLGVNNGVERGVATRMRRPTTRRNKWHDWEKPTREEMLRAMRGEAGLGEVGGPEE